MAAGSAMNNGLSRKVRSLLSELHEPTGRYGTYKDTMRSLGVELATAHLERQPLPSNVHVVTAVEDFEGFASGVIRAFERENRSVTYSCLWPQREITGPFPLREICPIYQAFHQKKPEGQYRLVLAVSSIGTIARVKASLVHTVIDEGYDESQLIDIIAVSSHDSVEKRLHEALPVELADRVKLYTAVTDFEISPDGFSIPGVGGNPQRLSGFKNNRHREYFLPERISGDFGIAQPNFEP